MIRKIAVCDAVKHRSADRDQVGHEPAMHETRVCHHLPGDQRDQHGVPPRDADEHEAHHAHAVRATVRSWPASSRALTASKTRSLENPTMPMVMTAANIR